MGITVPQPAGAATAVLWNRHGANIITSIITATQHRATQTGKMRIEGTHNGMYEIYLQLVHTDRLRENGRVVGWREERGCEGRWEQESKTVLADKYCAQFVLGAHVSVCTQCVCREKGAVQSVSLTQLVISRHVSKHC